jgi:hypothetical protein
MDLEYAVHGHVVAERQDAHKTKGRVPVLWNERGPGAISRVGVEA